MSKLSRPAIAKPAGSFTIQYEKSIADLAFSLPAAALSAERAIKKHFGDCECQIVSSGNSTMLHVHFQSYTHDGPGAVKRLHYFLLGLHEGWMLMASVPAPPAEEYFTVTHFVSKKNRRELHRIFPAAGNTPQKIAGQCCCVDDDVKAWGMNVECVEVYYSANDWAHKQRPIYTYTPLG
jgi:hypothetical protein